MKPNPAQQSRLTLVALLWVLITGGVLAAIWAAFCTTPFIYWNAPRLAPSFAIAAGLNPYATQASARHLGWQYGPVFPLAYLAITPCKNLDWAFALASAFNLFFSGAAVWVAARWVWQSRGLAAVAVVAGFAAALGSGNTFLWIHVDGVGVPLEILAVVAAARVSARFDRLTLHTAALCVALAIWTKQLAVVFALALAAWLAWRVCRRLACQFAGWCVAYAAGLGAIFVMWFGAEELWFNLWCIQAHNPWIFNRVALTHLWQGLGVAMWPLWLGLGVWLATRFWPAGPRLRTLIGLLLWMSVASLPIGLLAFFKTGGAANSFHSANYAMVAAVLVGLEAAQREKVARLIFAGMLLVAIAWGFVRNRSIGVHWLPSHFQQEQLAFARAHVGHVYFPWNPLVTIVSERRIFPTEDALYYLWLTKQEPPPAAVVAALPEQAVVVTYDPEPAGFAVGYLKRAQEASRQAKVEGALSRRAP